MQEIKSSQMLHQGPNNCQILSSPQWRPGVGSRGLRRRGLGVKAGGWPEGGRCQTMTGRWVGRSTTGGRDGRCQLKEHGRSRTDGRPRVDDAGWRHAGGRGRMGGHGRMMPFGGVRATEDGRADDGGWSEEAHAIAAGARRLRWRRSRRPV
jgi:hypothetical protein